jgi:hypothetical protein
MKKIYFYRILLLLALTSCEEVVDIDLNYSDERLVIEGQLNWIKENNQTEQLIMLSKTTPYFENLRIPANGAQVRVVDSKENIYQFQEEGNTGNYYPLDTIPYLLGAELTLHIDFENQTYSGSEVLNSVTSIYKIEQDSIPLFGNLATQLEAYSMDPVNEDNYSFFEFTSDRLDEPQYNVFRDDFSNGSEYYGVLFDSNLKKGDFVRIRQYGLSKTAYQFWFLLILQNTQQGGPFQTNPANLNGNMVNLSKPENSPLGYFRVSEVSEIIYQIK